MKINIALLAGGKGQRLWPISTENKPKQFIKLPNYNLSSFQLALINALELTSANNIYISINFKHLDETKKQITEIVGRKTLIKLIYEKESLNTGKAIYELCSLIHNDNLTYFFPTDHNKYSSNKFFIESLEIVNQYSINIFGQEATSICSQFGYVFSNKAILTNYYEVDKFIEKPSAGELTIFTSKFLFRNLGIYLAKPSVILNEFKKIVIDLDLLFSKSLSFDKIITEKSEICKCIKTDLIWQDLGSLENFFSCCPDKFIENCSASEEEIIKFKNNNREFLLEYNKTGIRIRKKNGTRSQT